jgi:hypothetical protein
MAQAFYKKFVESAEKRGIAESFVSANLSLAFAGGGGFGLGGFGGRRCWRRGFALASRLQARERLRGLLGSDRRPARGRGGPGLSGDKFFLGFVP